MGDHRLFRNKEGSREAGGRDIARESCGSIVHLGVLLEIVRIRKSGSLGKGERRAEG